MHRPSPATVLASVALAVSLGGNAAYAGKLLVTSRDIKDGTIQLADLAPASRAAMTNDPLLVQRVDFTESLVAALCGKGHVVADLKQDAAGKVTTRSVYCFYE